MVVIDGVQYAETTALPSTWIVALMRAVTPDLSPDMTLRCQATYPQLPQLHFGHDAQVTDREIGHRTEDTERYRSHL
ncbi:hypothetical protein [Mycolicibacterium houstonense]|uniref:hypothetical protein n=1 Tax=Mycolicibacterium houstonense TaxID=146021 RepID=UPI000833EC64|nr:hypothetical protein [Mycolicibacterium houstonense]